MIKSSIVSAALLPALTLLCWSADGARAEAPQVLVIPLTTADDAALGETAASLSESLRTVVAARGGHPIEAQATRADIAAMTGCSTDDDACLQTIAEAMGVTEVLLGSLEANPRGGLTVSITYYVVGGEARRDRIELSASEAGPATLELEPRATAFLAGEPAAPEPRPDLTPRMKTPDPPPPAAFRFGRVRTSSYVIAGSGAALVGLGVIFYAIASGKQDEVNEHPTDTLADLRALEDLESSGKTFTTLGNVGAIVGGLAAATGLSLIAIQGSRKERGPTVTPMPMQGGAGLTLTLWGTP